MSTLYDPLDCSPPGSSIMGFSRQEYWSVLPFPTPGDLPDTGIEPRSPTMQADALASEPPGKPSEPERTSNTDFSRCLHHACVCSVISNSFDPMECSPPRFLCPWHFPGKTTGVDCHFLLQGIFLTEGSNPPLLHLMHWRAGSSPVEPPRKPL